MEQNRFTKRQAAFIREYLIDLNATQAAIRAGYSEKTANRIASENLTKPVIQQAIAEAMEDRNTRLKADADFVMQRLLEIDGMDIGDILYDDGTIRPISEWPPAWRKYISSIDVSELWEGAGDQRQLTGLLKKLRWPDKLKNLELLGKHTSVQAFRDRIGLEHEGLHTVILHDPSSAD